MQPPLCIYVLYMYAFIFFEGKIRICVLSSWLLGPVLSVRLDTLKRRVYLEIG